MKNIIIKLSIESKQPIRVVTEIIEDITKSLIKEGCDNSQPKFLQYLVRRARKRLKIQESKTYKTFKQFFKEN